MTTSLPSAASDPNAPATDGRRRGVIIVGSLNADLVVRTDRFPSPGETVHGSDLRVLPGGKSANQAVAAARLGADVRIVGAVGADANGSLLLQSASAAGVDTADVRVLNGIATGTAIITVDARGENTIVISPGANGHLTEADVSAASFDGAAVLGLCLEVPMPVVVAAAERMRKAQGLVVTNLSPFGPVPAALLESTDVLLVNEHEAAQLGDHGVRRWIMTSGAAGCHVYDGDTEPVHVPAPTVDAVDTTGCGDAFMGAVAARLADGDSLLAAARYATLVGAFAATREGAQPSYPTFADIVAFAEAGASAGSSGPGVD
ncbi:ribokinase [Curtobacterium ammoniigenes]|uniref:ribokinase n=1 Tax=Curtobacterium ammoniigenes TaxID=395387 RepID=UPI0009FB267F|nr:ribokinase [Curtobacterium ammoniigenes]